MDEEYYKDAFKVLRLANRGAKKAQEENRRLGLPNVYAIEGKPVFVMPNGEIKTEWEWGPRPLSAIANKA
ncbi:MAG: hypothetical protein LBC85_03440 [Fibromonadaceae bacterium]|jgi:hypothetical protein|nr:hypothetical protein [Fibromonadaceae bacterium]